MHALLWGEGGSWRGGTAFNHFCITQNMKLYCVYSNIWLWSMYNNWHHLQNHFLACLLRSPRWRQIFWPSLQSVSPPHIDINYKKRKCLLFQEDCVLLSTQNAQEVKIWRLFIRTGQNTVQMFSVPVLYIYYVTLPPEMSRMDTVCYFEIFAS